MQISRKDLGYAVYSRLEEALRYWLKERLLVLFGADWGTHIPIGVWSKATENSGGAITRENTDDPLVLLDETDIPDLMEIASYKNGFTRYLPNQELTAEEFRTRMSSLYDLRNKIAHVKLNFGAVDLDLLIEISRCFLPFLQLLGEDLKTALDCIQTNPRKILIEIPSDFIVSDEKPAFAYLNNLPISDYDPDGGFIGRREDLARIENSFWEMCTELSQFLEREALAKLLSRIISRKTC